MTDWTVPASTSLRMSLGVASPATCTLPDFPACCTASAALGKATELIAHRPTRSGYAFIRSCATWNASLGSSLDGLVATSWRLGYDGRRSFMYFIHSF